MLRFVRVRIHLSFFQVISSIQTQQRERKEEEEEQKKLVCFSS